MRSYETFGQRKPVVASRDGVVIAGNHQLQAAEQLGWDSLAVVYVDDDEIKAKAFALADNRTADLGNYDEAALAGMLADVAVDADLLAATSFTEGDLAALLAGPPVAPLVDPDEILPLPADPITCRGDVWLLGPHRILCGSCRELADVQKVMDGKPVNVAFTSPPYASQRTYDESSGFRPIHPDVYVDWFEAVQANVATVLAPDGSWFVNIKEHAADGQRSLYVKDLTLAHVRSWSWLFVDEFCWTRPAPPGSWPDRFKNGWEPVLQFSLARPKFRASMVAVRSDAVPVKSSVAGANVSGPNGKYWNLSSETTSGLAYPSNVVSAAGVAAHSGHTAAFPVGLPQFFIKAYSAPGDAALDPFMGSGSTLIAAHHEGRVGYGIELSPAYVDVICRRYQALTGDKPVLEETGEPHDFAADG